MGFPHALTPVYPCVTVRDNMLSDGPTWIEWAKSTEIRRSPESRGRHVRCGENTMDFEQRLQRAIQRGEKSRDAADRADAARTLTTEEQRNRYSEGRLELSEHIETCLRKLSDYFPGFDFSSIV